MESRCIGLESRWIGLASSCIVLESIWLGLEVSSIWVGVEFGWRRIALRGWSRVHWIGDEYNWIGVELQFGRSRAGMCWSRVWVGLESNFILG